MLPTLKIDEEFKSIIPPLHRKEYLQLEQNILNDGCTDPIITWYGYIVDGHNRYEICHAHSIPFHTREMYFESREAVIAWICAHQLGRRNISEETRKYLIGRQYEAEKKQIAARNKSGHNQYTPSELLTPQKHTTAERIASENNICYGTVQKYAAYSRWMDTIAKKEPALAKKILSGQYRISHQVASELAGMRPEELRRINKRLENTAEPFVPYKQTRDAVGRSEKPPQIEGPSIKDMPAYDPDAEINSLSLTIPSWASSIDRVRNNVDFSTVTPKGRAGLMQALYILEKAIKDLFFTIEGS